MVFLKFVGGMVLGLGGGVVLLFLISLGYGVLRIVFEPGWEDPKLAALDRRVEGLSVSGLGGVSIAMGDWARIDCRGPCDDFRVLPGGGSEPVRILDAKGGCVMCERRPAWIGGPEGELVLATRRTKGREDDR